MQLPIVFYFSLLNFLLMFPKISAFFSSRLNRCPLCHPVACATNDLILRKVDKWACVKNCGACCKLGPMSSRPDLSSYLSPAELELYKSMIGEDEWCKNYDKASRMCTIYETRPGFCRVEPQKFKKMYEIEEEELNVSRRMRVRLYSTFATNC